MEKENFASVAGWEPTSEARAYMTSVYYVGEAVASEPLRRTREELFVNYADNDAAQIVYVPMARTKANARHGRQREPEPAIKSHDLTWTGVVCNFVCFSFVLQLQDVIYTLRHGLL